MKLAAALLGVALGVGLLPRPAAAQHVICCNLLVDFKGNWFGALRQCGEMLKDAKPQQIGAVCHAVRSNVCDEVAPYCRPCRGDEAKKRNPGGNALGPGDAAYDGLVDGARAAGISGFGPEHVAAQQRDGRVFWQIRLDAGGCPLPGGDCIMAAGEDGYLPEGKQVGAYEQRKETAGDSRKKHSP